MVEGTNGHCPWAPSSQWGCLVVCYDYSEGYRCHQQDELQSEYFDVNVSLHSTILYHQAVESIDGTTSTENDPHIVREHLFVISLGWYPGLPLSAQSSGIDSRISSKSVADENKTLWERIFGRGRTTGMILWTCLMAAKKLSPCLTREDYILYSTCLLNHTADVPIHNKNSIISWQCLKICTSSNYADMLEAIL